MANHVRYTIDFQQINKAALTKLAEICSRVREPEGYGDQWFGDMFVDGKEGSPTYEDTNNVNWAYENVGSKWCVLESMEIGETWAQIAGYAGWNQPEEGTQWLMEQWKASSDEAVDVDVITAAFDSGYLDDDCQSRVPEAYAQEGSWDGWGNEHYARASERTCE